MRSSPLYLSAVLAIVSTGCTSREAPPSHPPAPTVSRAAPAHPCVTTNAQTPSPATRSTCEETNGRLIEALRYATQDLGEQIKRPASDGERRDGIQQSRDRVKGLLWRIPRVDIELPESVSDTRIAIDGRRSFSTEQLGAKSIMLNPGEHEIEATGMDQGRTVHASHRVVVAESERAILRLRFE